MAGILASLGLRDRLPVLLPRLGDSGDPRSQLFDLAETLITPELREMELVMEEMGLRDEAGRGWQTRLMVANSHPSRPRAAPGSGSDYQEGTCSLIATSTASRASYHPATRW